MPEWLGRFRFAAIFTSSVGECQELSLFNSFPGENLAHFPDIVDETRALPHSALEVSTNHVTARELLKAAETMATSQTPELVTVAVGKPRRQSQRVLKMFCGGGGLLQTAFFAKRDRLESAKILDEAIAANLG